MLRPLGILGTDTLLITEGCELVEVPGDGDCLFHSYSVEWGRLREDHRECLNHRGHILRKFYLKYIDDHQADIIQGYTVKGWIEMASGMVMCLQWGTYF